MVYIFRCFLQDDDEIVLQRSGNPGYLEEQPVLAGTLTSM